MAVRTVAFSIAFNLGCATDRIETDQARAQQYLVAAGRLAPHFTEADRARFDQINAALSPFRRVAL